MNADGSLDGAFNPALTLVDGVTGSQTSVSALVVQSDGRILVGGFFDRVNGAVRSRIARLLPDGSNDASFVPGTGANFSVAALALQPDGKILLGGQFTSYNGTARNRIARVNSNGSLDLTFDPGTGPNSLVSSITLKPDGRALVGGWFSAYNGVSRQSVAQIMPDGSLDVDFDNLNSLTSFTQIAVTDPSGKVYVGDYNRVIRLNSDGSLDGGYLAADLTIVGSIGAIVRQADGRLLVGQGTGSSTNVPTVGIARVNVDGSRDMTFSVSGLKEAHVGAFSMLENGSLIVAGNVFDDGLTNQSGLARLVPIDAPGLTHQPQSQAAVESGAFKLSVTATGQGPFTYQWFKNDLPLDGETGLSLTIEGVSMNDAGSYFVEVGNAGGSTRSEVAVVTVSPPVAPSITLQPQSQSVSIGSSFTLSVGFAGSAPFTFQWRLDDIPIEGAVDLNYSVPTVQASDAGSYTVRVTNAAGHVTSAVAEVTVIPAGFAGLHFVDGAGYMAGETVTITNIITYSGTLSALGWQVLVPEGWSYVSSDASGAASGPAVDDTGFFDWAWSSVPPSPFTFSYTARVPENAAGPQEIVALMLPRQSGVPHLLLVKPDPLVVNRLEFHAADTNRNRRLELFELLRVIELYNTRNGTVRTGAYAIDADNDEDGFTTAPARASGTVVTLARYHSADTTRDGKLSLNELLRVIELYNYRAGTVRTGEYRIHPDTEDGFDPGP